MDIYKVLGKIRTGASLAEAFLDNNGIPSPAMALAALFDRRFTTLPSYLTSYHALVYRHQAEMPMLAKREQVRFPTSGHSLMGYLCHNPNPEGIVICVHGIFSLADNHNAVVQEYFLTHGFSVFAIDLSSSGQSEGTSIPGLHQSAIDIAAAEAYLHSRQDLKHLPICLFGHSWGAYGVCASLAFDSSPVAIAECSGFADPLAIMLGMPEAYIGSVARLTEPALRKAMEERGGEMSFLSAYEALEAHPDTQAMLVHGEEDNVIPLNEVALAGRKYRRKGIRIYRCPKKGHGDIYYSYKAIEYAKKVNEEADKLKDKYGKSTAKIPPEEKAAFLATFDKYKTSELDPKLFKEIEAMFHKACRKAIK